DVLAKSRGGRSVSIAVLNPLEPPSGKQKLKILMFAQQHGDEASGKEAMTIFLARWASGDYAAILQNVDLCIVPQMNPDGSELQQRRTRDGIDLNRSHVLLNSPEVAALHEFFLRWQPEVTLDVHEYGAYSRSWSDSGFIKRGDVQLGMLSNLNSSARLRAYQRESVYPSIASAMSQAGYAFHEYIVGTPRDRVRHSTTEINDGRQSFGILNTLSFIQEGWKGRTPEENLERRAKSQLLSIEALLRHCDSHAAEIRELVQAERRECERMAGKPFALRMEHVHSTGALRIPVRLVPSGADTTWEVTPYHDVVRATAETTVPSAYVVPAGLRSVIDFLTMHHVSMEPVPAERTVEVEAMRIDSVGFDVLEEDSLPRPFTTTERSVLTIQPGDFIVPTSQWHGLFLPTVLEPASMWGLTKYESYSWLLKKGRYPIFRIR
ncbi:MAG TPA: M14 family zinc carboxypeptidase, partial [Bacteroidota bacterium]|nr:M14 family zinc carboxypeptidase [Bacteroidota bacterium]